jgi:hypothetical protein
MNSSSTVSAEVGLWLVTTPQTIVPVTGELISPCGRARFETPAREVTDFLSRAYQIVPDGQESGRIDIDAELDSLLRQAS